MSAVTLDQALQLGQRALVAGHLAQAESVCRDILAAFPGQAGALHLLGGVALKANQPKVAGILQGRKLPPDLAWLGPMGTWSAVSRSDDEGITGYSISGSGNQGFVIAGAMLASVLEMQQAGLFPEPGAAPTVPQNPVAPAALPGTSTGRFPPVPAAPLVPPTPPAPAAPPAPPTPPDAPTPPGSTH